MVQRNDNPNFARLQGDAEAILALPEVFGVSEVDEMVLGPEVARTMLESAARQIADGRGATADDPLTGLGVDGLYVFIRSSSLKALSQSASLLGAGRILDRMRVAGDDMEGQYEVVLYNLVER